MSDLKSDTRLVQREIDRLVSRLGDAVSEHDPPLAAQHHFLAAQGDLGQSYIYKRPTVAIVLAKFPASFELVLAASLIVLFISLPAGIYCAVKPRSLGARLMLGLSVLGISVPVFLTGIILISVFSVWLGWLPAFGRGETVRLGFWETGLCTLDGLKHLLLPAVTLSSIMLPLFIRLVRGAMLDQLGTD